MSEPAERSQVMTVADVVVQILEAVEALRADLRQLRESHNALLMRVAALEPPLTYADAPSYGGTEL